MVLEYGDRRAENGEYERAYLSRLHAVLVNFGFRGKFSGTEPVEDLFELLHTTSLGSRRARSFVRDHGEGEFGPEPNRTRLKTVRIAPRVAYEDS